MSTFPAPPACPVSTAARSRSRHTPSRRRRASLIALGLTVGVLLAGGAIAAAPPGASAATVDTTAWYVLVARHSGKALDVYERATGDGAGIVQWSRNDGAWQQWRFVDAGNGHYRLRSRHSGKVLDVRDSSTADGADVVQWSDVDRASQQWRLADSDAGHVRLINRNSDKALDVWERSTADGARISQWTDWSGTNQQWQLVRVDAPGTPTPTPGIPPGSYPDPMRVTGDTGVHDPSMIRRPTGGYLMAHTGNDVALKTSTDRVSFRNAGSVFPGGAPWTTPYTGGSRNLWAPDLSFHDNRYYLYYSASTFGSNRSAIFLATSSTGASGSWTNQGLIVESQSSDTFNAIDPNLIVDDQGRWWLSFGSFWSGIKMIALDPDTGRRSGSAMHSLAGRGGGAIEAPTLVNRGGHYYLYVSFDRCCQGAASTYRVMVGRSTSVTGPFTDRSGNLLTAGGGTQILAGHGGVNGPGHQAVLADADGDYLLYHYYANNGAALLGINRIGYDAAGWPYLY
ncbi:arabinan endo-1,5-alpha-L-arabinosidase [Micromonospora sp. Llam0]|uniref:family 43 glycosylhydrolase n=1 Tax=Micromonospora sp. Llam0 TaxID=2485143 RepID=UPI000F49629B|nr:family 43 glycosylhydrolase [Micromonospora sp. Llam0]ROO59075.1 arabinan endo-1,5-alpha-L-arabinosidase [Micromonospora sp. Llam0]